VGKNIGEQLLNIGLGKDYWGMIPKAQVTKGTINKSDYIKLK
jgi:hypothetical protein